MYIIVRHHPGGIVGAAWQPKLHRSLGVAKEEALRLANLHLGSRFSPAKILKGVCILPPNPATVENKTLYADIYD